MSTTERADRRILQFTLPLVDNEGLSLDDAHADLCAILVDRFGGYTCWPSDGGWQPSPAESVQIECGTTYRVVVAGQLGSIVDLLARIHDRFRQHEVLATLTPATVIITSDPVGQPEQTDPNESAVTAPGPEAGYVVVRQSAYISLPGDGVYRDYLYGFAGDDPTRALWTPSLSACPRGLTRRQAEQDVMKLLGLPTHLRPPKTGALHDTGTLYLVEPVPA